MDETKTNPFDGPKKILRRLFLIWLAMCAFLFLFPVTLVFWVLFGTGGFYAIVAGITGVYLVWRFRDFIGRCLADIWYAVKGAFSERSARDTVTEKIVETEVVEKEDSEAAALEKLLADITYTLDGMHDGARWKWQDYPSGFAVNGGITRIITKINGRFGFADVVLSKNGELEINLITDTCSDDSIEETACPDTKLGDTAKVVSTDADPITYDSKEGAEKWYNIVLNGTLTELVTGLNDAGILCLSINQNGEVLVGEESNPTITHKFNNMPKMEYWEFVVTNLIDKGLHAEVDGDMIFVSWA